MSNQERTPLLSTSGGGGDNGGYYFLNDGNKEGGNTLVRDSDGGAVVEGLPSGATPEEFRPKVIGSPKVKRPQQPFVQPPEEEKKSSGDDGGLFSKLLGRKKETPLTTANAVPSAIKQRKAPIKVEPKVFFANERTFLAWMHISIILAGASVAILAFADENENPGSQIYGVVMLPVAIAFIVYSMYQYVKRAYMIRNKHPGPYDDTVGPTVLGVMLMLSILCQFAIKLYSMSI